MGEVEDVCFDDRFNVVVGSLIIINVFIRLHIQGGLSRGGRFLGVRVNEIFNRVVIKSIILLHIVISCHSLEVQNVLLRFLP